MKLRMGVKCLSCGIDVANGGVRCTNCELKFCVTCTFRLSTDEEPFVCIICKGGDDFFEERSKKAQPIRRVTDEALVLASTWVLVFMVPSPCLNRGKIYERSCNMTREVPMCWLMSNLWNST